MTLTSPTAANVAAIEAGTKKPLRRSGRMVARIQAVQHAHLEIVGHPRHGLTRERRSHPLHGLELLAALGAACQVAVDRGALVHLQLVVEIRREPVAGMIVRRCRFIAALLFHNNL
jgi:hypothetical protein